MNYLSLLNLYREPFSNSPDPFGYYASSAHAHCLNHLEIGIRLKRGMNVVLGKVGTGKSTLCRCLLQSLSKDDTVDCFLILDCGFEDERSCMSELYRLLLNENPPENISLRDGMDALQKEVYRKALEEKRTLVLLLDEGQKLSLGAMEVLRQLLNFETNTEKLLQLVIFSQPEFAKLLDAQPNFKDRINEFLWIEPLNEEEAAALIRYRLFLAGGHAAENLFSQNALKAVHEATGGVPRQIMRLGHQLLLRLIMSNTKQVSAAMVKAQVESNAEGHEEYLQAAEMDAGAGGAEKSRVAAAQHVVPPNSYEAHSGTLLYVVEVLIGVMIVGLLCFSGYTLYKYAVQSHLIVPPWQTELSVPLEQVAQQATQHAVQPPAQQLVPQAEQQPEQSAHGNTEDHAGEPRALTFPFTEKIIPSVEK